MYGVYNIMFLVDSHCHLNQLNYKNIHKNVSDVLYKANQKGIKLFLSVSTDFLDYDNLLQNIGYRDNVVFSCGVHPVNLCAISHFDRSTLIKLASNKHVVAIGETGLDYYHSIEKKDIQKLVFREHINVAKNISKPLIVHSRNAIEDTIILLREENAEQCSGILHCFNENINYARALLNINFYISFSGMITFSKFDWMKKVIQYVPLDRILLETDSPYLAPVPYRGKENQPAYLYEIAKYVAQVKDITMDNLSHITTANFYKLFNIL